MDTAVGNVGAELDPVVGRRLNQSVRQASEPIDTIRPAEMIEIRLTFVESISAADTISATSASLSFSSASSSRSTA